MKFGKYLASRQLELPEYSSHFIDYKALKKLIKHLAIPTTFNNNSFGEAINISQNEIQNTLKENKASFFFRVERELDKVNSFYLEKQANLAINLDLLMVKYRDVLEKCVASTKSTNDSNSEPLNSFENSNFRNSISFLNLYQNFKKIHQDLIRLQQFIELNETGFSKVLKKWDKRSKSHTKELFLLTAVNVQPVFHKNEINELSDIVTQSIFDLESIMDGDLSILKNYNPVIGVVPNRLVSSNSSLTTFNDKEKKIGSDYSGISRHGSIVNIENNHIDELYTSFVNIATIKDPDLSLLARWIEKVEGSSEGNKVNKMSKILLLAITNLKISDTFLESFLNLIHYEVEFISIKDNFNNNKNIIHECCSIPPASTYESSHHVVINNGVKIINSVDSINHSRIFLLNHIMTNTPIEKCKDLLIWKDFNGRTCLHYAAQNNRLDILDIILPHFPKENIDDLDNESISALLLAIKYGHFEIMKKLVELGSNCFPNNDKKKLQYLPINYACKYGDFKTIEFLLSHNTPSESFINKQDFEGLLPLHVVAREGHYHLIKLLIDHGAEVNILDGFNKWTPLFYAALEGHVKTTQELVKFGAKLDIVDNDGYNVLYYCIIEGHINVLNEILKIENNILNCSTKHSFESKNGMNDMIVTNESNLDMDESEDSGGLEKNVSDSIPDLVLPPPILPLRRYGHNFLEQKIFIELILPDDSELIRLFNSETDLKPGRMTLTSNISDIVPRNIILPLSDNAVLSGNCIFQTDIDSLPEFRIDIEVFPKFGTRLIAKSTLLLMSQITSTSSEIKPILLPLFDLRLRNIGELKFSYQVIFPFSGTLLETSKFDTYWKSSTSYMKNNRVLRLNAAGGLSPNDILSPTNINNGSSNNNTAKGDGFDNSKMQSSSVVTATSLSGEYLRIRVCLLSDGTPVVCPSWCLSITDSIQLYLPNLSLDQLSSITDNLFDYEKVFLDLSKMSASDIPLIKKLLRILYMPLSAFLDILSNDININLEIIFPSLFEIRNLPFIGNIQRNLNKFIDNTLTDVFEHTRKQKSKNLTPGRSVLFLSSNSLICKVLNWKQPNFPVFLIMNGISYCHISKSFESRTTNGLSKKSVAVQKQQADSGLVEDLETIKPSPDIHPEEKTICSIKEAMDFATKNNLIGLVISIHLLDLAPKLVPLIRARGLVLVASCDTSSIEEEFEEGELESYSKNDINGLRFGDILSFKEELAM